MCSMLYSLLIQCMSAFEFSLYLASLITMCVPCSLTGYFKILTSLTLYDFRIGIQELKKEGNVSAYDSSSISDEDEWVDVH